MSNTNAIKIVFREGRAEFVNNPALSGLLSQGTARVTRASHVLPVSLPLRALFVILRRAFGETGAVSQFTRRWPCLWRVDLAPSGGPVIGPFKDREEAISREVEWLNTHRL